MIKNNRYNIIVMFILALFLLWGLLAFRDYGISWDEEIQRNRGLAGLRTAIVTLAGEEAVPERLNAPEVVARGTGMLGIKLPVVLAEYITDFKMSNGQVFRMYHLYNFLLFFISAFFLWRLLLLLGFSDRLSITGLLLYLLCPRILADSFYNNKDLAFLSMYTMVIYFSVALVKKYTVLNVAGLILATAFAFNTRAIGPLPVVVFAIYFLVRALLADEVTEGEKSTGAARIVKPMLQIFIPAIICLLVYFLITPKMWAGVVASLSKKVNSTFSFSHGGFDVIGGRTFNRQDLPWYYLPFTIALTVPSVYLLFSTIGTIQVMLGTIRGFFAQESESKEAESKGFNLINALKLWLSDENNALGGILWLQYIFIVGYTMVARPMQYNYWRHFFFIFVYMVVFTMYGLKWCIANGRTLKILTYIFVSISIILSVRWIAVNHPYEYLYFNPLFNGDMAKNSDQDYWAVSYQKLLSQIVDGSDENVYIFPTLTGNQLFGEAGYENYHLEALKNSAKYRIDAANPGKDNFYTVLKTVEVDGRYGNFLMRRVNYGNALRKYYFENGEFTGTNTGVELGLTSYNEGVDKCILMSLPGKLSVKEIDFLYGDMHPLTRDENLEEEIEEGVTYADGQVITNVRAYISKDCASWRRLNDDCVLDERDIFGVSLGEEDELSGYLLLRYEDETEEGADFEIRVYGEEAHLLAQEQNKADIYYNRFEAARVITDIVSNEGSSKEELELMLDGKENTVFATKNSQSEGTYIQFSLEDGFGHLRGIHIDEGSYPMNDGRSIRLEGSVDGKEFKELTWYYGGMDDYLFDEPGEYSSYRITLMEDSDYAWAISELGLIR